MNTTFSIAFLAGLISFLSPCVLPLIPGYISYISGTSIDKLVKTKNKNLTLVKTILFTLGFSFVFIVMGSTASFLGKFFLINSNIFRIIAGLIIIFFSLQLLDFINFKFLNKDVRFFTNRYNHNLTFSFIVGAAFGFGWTPCIGPILGSILALSAIEDNINQSILLLGSYSLGLAIPFILSGILIEKFLLFSKNFKKYIIIVRKTGGVILLLTGVGILTGQLQILGFFILEYFPYLNNFS
jgi:cytochrome c-type biogenesis protein